MIKMLMQRNMSLTENMAKLTQSQVQFQETTAASIQNFERQMGQLSQVVGKLEVRDSGKLPSQTEENPNIRNVSAVTLISGRELQKTGDSGDGGDRRRETEDHRPEDEGSDRRPDCDDCRQDESAEEEAGHDNDRRQPQNS